MSLVRCVSQHITHDDSSLLSPSATLLYLLPYAHDNHSGASVYIRTACNTAIPSVSRQKLNRKKGRIINIASLAGKVGLLHGAAYASSKHGLLGLTRSLALE